jgi:signal transduction histidine kinase
VVVGDDGIVASAAPERARSGPETRVAGPEKPKSVVNVSPNASDVIDEGPFEGLIRPSLASRKKVCPAPERRGAFTHQQYGRTKVRRAASVQGLYVDFGISLGHAGDSTRQPVDFESSRLSPLESRNECPIRRDGLMRIFTRRTLFWKYAAYFAGLVSALLVISGAVGGYFAYRESVATLEDIQRAKAKFAATEIASYMRRAQDAIQQAVNKFNTTGNVDSEDLRIELTALLRHHPEISDLRWIDAAGDEQLALSRLGLNTVNSGRNWSEEPRFLGARRTSYYVGRVYFRKETEPYVPIAAASHAGAVLAAEVDLKYVWDVIAQAHLTPGGIVYVVDRSGQLISHPDITLVLARSDFSILPQVRMTLDRPKQKMAVSGEARDIKGLPVVSTAAPIENLGWTVFAEQSLEEAFRPVYASIARSVVLVLLGIFAAIAASLLLAHRMVRPIREIEIRAKELGEGQFDRRINLQTGDELEALASQFNRMAARLQETYAMQETRIVERTHALAAANEAKSRFLAAASHDLRQPMHALSLFVGQLRGIELPIDGTTLLLRIERSVDALGELLEALLDLSKLDVGAVSPVTKAFPLRDLLSRLAVQFAPSAEAKGLALTFVETSLWIRSDPLLLERIFLNVISNALRYTDEGRILIGCRRRGDDVEVVVADTGIGIDPNHLPKVFQEFYRAVPTHRGGGTGLGLAIVRRLAVLLDHQIAIESVPGRGTIVRVLVHREQPQQSTIVPQAAIVDSLRGVRVLVVDDEAPARDAMQGLLTQWGCEVTTAENGDQAVARARERRPDVILCDLRLAGAESGVGVLERLQRECGPGIACAFVTGESAPEVIAAAVATGFPIALKPTTPGKLRATLEHLVHSD